MASTCRRLEGKVAVVTAATEGIGLAIAERLGQEGASVVVSSRKQSNVDRTVQAFTNKGIKVVGTTCHVAKKEDREKLLNLAIEKFGGVNILVSNAGVNPMMGPMLDTPESAWDKIFDVNVKASFYLVKEFVPVIEKQGGGSVILISSLGGHKPNNMLGAYSVSKTAMLGLTKALVPELSARNIRINSICPGVIVTKMAGALHDSGPASDAIKNTIPMQRFGQSHECAGLAAFLASDDASYMTGENIVIGGGSESRL